MATGWELASPVGLHRSCSASFAVIVTGLIFYNHNDDLLDLDHHHHHNCVFGSCFDTYLCWNLSRSLLYEQSWRLISFGMSGLQRQGSILVHFPRKFYVSLKKYVNVVGDKHFYKFSSWFDPSEFQRQCCIIVIKTMSMLMIFDLNQEVKMSKAEFIVTVITLWMWKPEPLWNLFPLWRKCHMIQKREQAQLCQKLAIRQQLRKLKNWTNQGFVLGQAVFFSLLATGKKSGEGNERRKAWNDKNCKRGAAGTDRYEKDKNGNISIRIWKPAFIFFNLNKKVTKACFQCFGMEWSREIGDSKQVDEMGPKAGLNCSRWN